MASQALCTTEGQGIPWPLVALWRGKVRETGPSGDFLNVYEVAVETLHQRDG